MSVLSIQTRTRLAAAAMERARPVSAMGARERDDGIGKTVLKALGLGLSLIGIAAGLMVIMAILHEGWQ